MINCFYFGKTAEGIYLNILLRNVPKDIKFNTQNVKCN